MACWNARLKSKLPASQSVFQPGSVSHLRPENCVPSGWQCSLPFPGFDCRSTLNPHNRWRIKQSRLSRLQAKIFSAFSRSSVNKKLLLNTGIQNAKSVLPLCVAKEVRQYPDFTQNKNTHICMIHAYPSQAGESPLKFGVFLCSITAWRIQFFNYKILIVDFQICNITSHGLMFCFHTIQYKNSNCKSTVCFFAVNPFTGVPAVNIFRQL